MHDRYMEEGGWGGVYNPPLALLLLLPPPPNVNWILLNYVVSSARKVGLLTLLCSTSSLNLNPINSLLKHI